MGDHRPRQPNMGALLFFAFWFIAAVALLVGSLFTRDGDIALYGVLACLLVTIPMLSRNYDWVSPWSLVALAIYIGCGARGFAILELGLDHPMVNRLYLRGRDIAEYDWPATLFLIGVALFTFAYMAGRLPELAAATRPPRRRRFRTVPRTPRYRRSKPPQRGPYRFSRMFWPVVMSCAAVGFWAFLQYTQATGGLDLSNLSAKRAGFYLGAAYKGGGGQWRTINDLASVAFWLAVAKFASARARTTPAQKLGLLLLFANAALLPFYSSSRSEIIYIVLTALAIQVCIGGRIKFGAVVKTGVAALAILAVTTFLRQQSEGARAAFDVGTALRSVSDAVILGLNFSEVPKAVNIMLAVPDQLPYSNGSTIANYAVAWIPRSIWPEKPIIDAGVPVGVLVYHSDGTAVPPGAIAEFYWAWGAVGIIIGSLLFGFVLRRLHERTRRHTSGVAGALMYASAVFNLGGNAISGSVGYAFYSALMAAAMMGTTLWFAGTRKPPERPPSRRRSKRSAIHDPLHSRTVRVAPAGTVRPNRLLDRGVEPLRSGPDRGR